uniref:Ring hydroxylating beta subunit n=1 Tax=Candidatus Kentrum sp. TUN TaxID=2126343 RepID=A0A450ZUA2_9GAMM|nr:MAG: Ring hydroxylating beta subunit [Candidatus Kentron sp. TUN]VFK57382.1 MAG: Ring hydroxylating beta subunit [Candidatus Kentron sp. TUN]
MADLTFFVIESIERMMKSVPLVPKLQFGNLFPEAVASQDLRSQAGAWDRANHRTHGTGSLLHGGSYFLRHRVYRTHDEVSWLRHQASRLRHVVNRLRHKVD